MLFEPTTKTLYSNEGVFIKKTHCPLQMLWDDLKPIEGASEKKYCTNCSNIVLDTGELDDSVLVAIVQEKPDTCLKIDMNQTNLLII